MSDFRVLYYPFYEPSNTWLRSNLLFFDKIESIVPKDQEHMLSDNLVSLEEECGFFGTVSPHNADLYIDENNYSLLDKAFHRISLNKQSMDADGINHYYDLSSSMFLHPTKISHKILSLLKKYNLIDIASTNQYGALTDDSFVVNKKAGSLILSLLADNIAKNKGLNTATDQNLDFMVNSLNSFEFDILESSKNMLMKSIIDCSIPDSIDNLDLDDYLLLRDEYKDIRLLFQKTISELKELNNLESISDASYLSAKIKDVTEEFETQVGEVKTLTPYKLMKWSSYSFGAISACSVLYPGAAIPFGLATLGFEVLSHRYHSDENNIYRMISGIRKDISKMSNTKSLL